MVKFLNGARVSVLRRSPTASLMNEKEIDAYVAPAVYGFVRVPIGNRFGSSSSLTRVELESVIAEILFDNLGELCGAEQASESTTCGSLLVFQRDVTWKYVPQEASTLRSLVASQVGNDEAPNVSIHEQFIGIGEALCTFPDLLSSMLYQRDDNSLRVVALCCHAQLVAAVGTEASLEAIVPVLMQGALTTSTSDRDEEEGSTGGLTHRTMVRHYSLPAERTLAGWSAAPPKALVTSVEGWLREICFKVGILPKYGA
jgi:hypothetical protein